MRRLNKTERALLAAVVSAGTAAVVKTIRLINAKKDYIITKAVSEAKTANADENNAAESTEENE